MILDRNLLDQIKDDDMPSVSHEEDDHEQRHIGQNTAYFKEHKNHELNE